MTKLEFNIFLTAIGGLKSTYKTDVIITDATYFDVGEGWYSLIKSLIEELISAGWNKEVSQVKEKFGGLRFYIGGATEECYEIISKYEQQSYLICEVCGEEGKLIQDGWWRTLCDKHSVPSKIILKEN